MRTTGLVVVAGLLAGLAACGADESEPQRAVSVCVPVTAERPAGVQGRVEIRESATVLASASIASGGSFEVQVPADAAVDVYVDGVLLGSSAAGDVALNCPSS